MDAKRDVVDDSDDFVFIEQTAVHPWRALDSNQYTGSTGSSPKAAIWKSPLKGKLSTQPPKAALMATAAPWATITAPPDISR